MKSISRFYGHLASDSLCRNPFYLMLSAAVMAFIGFCFGLVSAAVSLIYLLYGAWGKLVAYAAHLAHNNAIPFIVPDPIWSIGIYRGESPTRLASPGNINPVLTCKDVTDAAAKFVADPFMVKEGQTWYMFFEIFNRHTNRGEIGVATSDDNDTWKYQRIVLKESFHLSYPYVFNRQDEYFMIPECSGTKSVRLYRAVDFPTRWAFECTLIEGTDYVDPSVVHLNDRWWLFTSSGKSNILRLHYADDLTGRWTEHPQSPVLRNNSHSARPGGRIVGFEDPPRAIRYAQDCEPVYGGQVRAFEVTKLTTTSYEEKECTGNPVLKAAGASWNAHGMHSLDPHLVGNRWVACVDGHVDNLRLGFNRRFAGSIRRLSIAVVLRAGGHFLQGQHTRPDDKQEQVNQLEAQEGGDT